MPRNVRNFWLDAHIDGRRSSFASGPRARDGGFELVILSRDQGEVSRSVLHIRGRSHDGKLIVTVDDGGREVLRKETLR